jgi:hypothetical protein
LSSNFRLAVKPAQVPSPCYVPRICYADSTPVLAPVRSAALVPPELLDPVVAYFQPRRVILFGSAASDEADPDGDIDLLAVVDDDTPAEKVTIKAGRESRRPYSHPADVIPVREETWRRFSHVVGTLPYAARTDGIVVYERR